MRLLRVVAVCCGVLILSMVGIVAVARAGADDEPYLLLFEREVGSGRAIYRMNPDGSGAARVAFTLNLRGRVFWSPRDLTVTYLGFDLRTNSELHRVRWDGAAARRLTALTDENRFANYASWSPDGEALLVESIGADPGTRLNQVAARSGMAHSSALSMISANDVQYAVTSPDGQWIVYQSSRAGNFDIYVMRADGSDERRVVGSPLHEVYPQWSPDGSRILFTRRLIGGALVLCDIAPGGSDLREITMSRSPFGNIARYSPDGRWIAYTFNENDEYFIYRIPADGGNTARLVGRVFDFRAPAWSPDSKWLAFISEQDGNPEIYRMRVDGSDVQRLTDNEVTDQSPAWSPVYSQGWEPGALLMLGLVMVVAGGMWSRSGR
jgi:Tol biopolymer transport system component